MPPHVHKLVVRVPSRSGGLHYTFSWMHMRNRQFALFALVPYPLARFRAGPERCRTSGSAPVVVVRSLRGAVPPAVRY